MQKSPRFKLFLMMALEFFIWGCWLPLIYGYLPSLGFTPGQQSWILNAFPISAIIGMFFSTQFADRRFSAEKFMAFSHLVGGAAILGLAFTRSFVPFCLLMFIHCLFYVPTISIANSIAFTHIKDAQKEFGLIRVGGTIGWILAAWPFTFILVDWAKVKEANPQGVGDWLGTVLASGLTGDALQHATTWTFIVAGLASLVLAAFSLTLPHTPPKPAAEGVAPLAWLEAMKLLGLPFILVLWLVTFVDATVHNLYFNWTGRFLGSAVAAGGVGIPGETSRPVEIEVVHRCIDKSYQPEHQNERQPEEFHGFEPGERCHAFRGRLRRRMRQCQAERGEHQRCETGHDERPGRGML